MSYVPRKPRTLTTSTELHGTFKRRAFTALSAMVVLGGIQMTTGLTPASAAPPPPTSTTTISYRSTAYVDPAGVTSLAVTVVGAGGGGQHGAIAPGTAGQGASVHATIPATAGSTLYAEVGSSSGAGGGGATGPAANGGGESALQSCSVGAGGARTPRPPEPIRAWSPPAAAAVAARVAAAQRARRVVAQRAQPAPALAATERTCLPQAMPAATAVSLPPMQLPPSDMEAPHALVIETVLSGRPARVAPVAIKVVTT